MGILMAWASRGVNASVADHLFNMSQPKFTMIYPFLLILKCSCFSFFSLLMHLLARKGAGSSSSWSSAVEDQLAILGKRCRFLVQFCLIAFTVRRLKQVSNLIRSTLYAFWSASRFLDLMGAAYLHRSWKGFKEIHPSNWLWIREISEISIDICQGSADRTCYHCCQRFHCLASWINGHRISCSIRWTTKTRLVRKPKCRNWNRTRPTYSIWWCFPKAMQICIFPSGTTFQKAEVYCSELSEPMK